MTSPREGLGTSARRRIRFVAGALALGASLLAAGAGADEPDGGSFRAYLDDLSDEDPIDRFAVVSALSGDADYATFSGGLRARLNRRFNLLGGLSGMPFEAADDPQYFGLFLAAQEDLIARPNGRAYVGLSYTAYLPSSTGPWEGEAVHALAIGAGFSQGMPLSLLFRMRLFLETSWVTTGEGTWTLPAAGSNPARESTDDFTGYRLLFGGEFIL